MGTQPTLRMRSLRAPAEIFLLLLGLFLIPRTVTAQSTQQTQPVQPAQPATHDYSANPNWIPHILAPYKQSTLPPVDLNNSKDLSQIIHDGKIVLSLAQFVNMVVENNLTLATDRYNYPTAQADLLRAKGGQAARGVAAAGANIPDEFFSAAIGAGVGNLTALGGLGNVGSVSAATRTLALTPRGAYDPTLLFNFSLDRTASPLNSVVVAGVPNVTTDSAFYQAGWEQAFTTGTSFYVALSNQRQDSTQFGLLYDPDVITRMTVGVIQQVTNGFGFEVNRRFITAARTDIGIVRNWFEQQLDTTLEQAEDAYWGVVSAQEQVKSAQEALIAAEKLTADDQKKLAAGTLGTLDVMTAQSGIATGQRNLIVAQTNLQQQELNLKTFFAKRITPELGDADIVAIDPLPKPEPSDVPAFEDALRTAMVNRPELPQAEGVVANDHLSQKVTRNFLKPTFNIFGYFASAGLSGNSLEEEAGGRVLVQAGLPQELAQFFDGKYPEYAYGFSLTIPLRNRGAVADNIRATMDEQQDEASLRREGNQIEVEVRSAIAGMLQAREEVEAAHQAAESSRLAADAEQKKRDLGTSTTYNVLVAQNAVLTSELTEVQANVAYADALVEMNRSMGTILDKNHINLDEALQGRVGHVSTNN